MALTAVLSYDIIGNELLEFDFYGFFFTQSKKIIIIYKHAQRALGVNRGRGLSLIECTLTKCFQFIFEKYLVKLLLTKIKCL